MCYFSSLGVATLVLGAVLSLAGCGFHLRGDVEVPPELTPMYIQAAEGSPVRKAILQRLQRAKVQLAAKPEDARIAVRIGGESRSTRVAAVDRNRKVLARELHYHVTFDAVAGDGKQRVPTQTLDLVRIYENPEVEVLGKQQEATLIYEDLVQDAADRILFRLRAALLNKPAGKGKSGASDQ